MTGADGCCEPPPFDTIGMRGTWGGIFGRAFCELEFADDDDDDAEEEGVDDLLAVLDLFASVFLISKRW